MSPYIIDDKEVPRVTEKIGAGECKSLGWFEQELPYNRTRTAHVVTVPGTLTHIRIEQRLRRQWKLPGKSYGPDMATVMLLRKLRRYHKKQKAKHPKAITAWETIRMKADQCFKTFEVFFAEYPVKPYLGMIEHRFYSKHFDYAGTVDLIFQMGMKGRLEVCNRLPDELQDQLPYKDNKEFFIECGAEGPKVHDPSTCDCQWFPKVVTIADWKTSSRRQPSHQHQMAAYHQAGEEQGLFDKIRATGCVVNWHTWSVLLGEHGLKKTETPYQLIKYPAEFTGFLEDSTAYNKPRYITMNQKGDIGLKGRCMFCADFLRCPDRVNWNPACKGEITLTSWTEHELKMLQMVLHKSVQSRSQFAELKEKVDYMYQQLKEIREVEGGLNTDIETMLQDYGLKTAPVSEWGTGEMPAFND